MKNLSNKNRKQRLPSWQSDKMRTLIEDRWDEVWEAVVTRHNFSRSSRRHLEKPPHNPDIWS